MWVDGFVGECDVETELWVLITRNGEGVVLMLPWFVKCVGSFLDELYSVLNLSLVFRGSGAMQARPRKHNVE